MSCGRDTSHRFHVSSWVAFPLPQVQKYCAENQGLRGNHIAGFFAPLNSDFDLWQGRPGLPQYFCTILQPILRSFLSDLSLHRLTNEQQDIMGSVTGKDGVNIDEVGMEEVLPQDADHKQGSAEDRANSM